MNSRLIEKYVIRSVLPYTGLAAMLLTAVLLAQQINRLAEILGAARAPLRLAFDVLLALLPGILIFTLPMAMLAGCVIGLSRMGSDSELVAMRAAGIGKNRLLIPLLIIGTVFSLITMYLGLEAAPKSARDVRRLAFEAALHRLESPVEPRTFNTEIPGKIIYVRDGNERDGSWGRVFIHARQANGETTLVTARAGRIDSRNISADEIEERGSIEAQAELVLSDAAVTTLSLSQGGTGAASPSQVVTERVGETRMKLDAPSQSLYRRMQVRQRDPEELQVDELVARAQGASDEQTRRQAILALNKKLALGLSPLVFALLGAGIGMRVRRGGRGAGVAISLFAMICYYLIFLGGEQFARSGAVRPVVGTWLAVGVAILIGLGLILIGDRRLLPKPKRKAVLYGGAKQVESPIRVKLKAVESEGRRTRLLILGLMDQKLLGSLGWNFCFALTALTSVFLLFTLFELARHFSTGAATINLVAQYLFYLVPFIGVALAPVSLLVAILATYAVVAKRGEAIAWWASGQSLYRLAFPCVIAAATVSTAMWFVQERILPESNRRQDALRAQIRGVPAAAVTSISTASQPQQWLAVSGENRIYSYEHGGEQGNELGNLTIYEFTPEGVHLRAVTVGQTGLLFDGKLKLTESIRYDLETGIRISEQSRELETDAGDEGSGEAFKPMLIKPSHLDSKSLSNYIKLLKRRDEAQPVRPLILALERRRSDLLAPLVMALIGVPLALAFGRRSAVTALCMAVIVGLLFWAAVGIAQQAGVNGWLPPTIAAWSPTAIFLAVGLYLLARART